MITPENCSPELLEGIRCWVEDTQEAEAIDVIASPGSIVANTDVWYLAVKLWRDRHKIPGLEHIDLKVMCKNQPAAHSPIPCGVLRQGQ